MQLNKNFLRAIQSGRSLLFIGSGPSCEMGYPNWEELCVKTYEHIKQLKNIDVDSYEKYIKQKKYPSMLSQAEIDFGGRENLISYLKTILVSKNNGSDTIYKTICNWPIACFITTNYDDEIYRHLQSIGIHYQTVRNSRDEINLIRDGVSHLIIKLHGDFVDPTNIVLTSNDYQEFLHGPNKNYLREKIKAIFHFFDVIIIGYNLGDPNINFLLEAAKDNSNPLHPIYIFSSELSKAEIREHYEQRNIIVIPYDNPDKEHNQLKKLLKFLSKLIPPNKIDNINIPSYILDEEEINIASSLFLYRKLYGLAQNEPMVMSSIISTLILKTLSKIPKNTPLKKEELINKQPLSFIKKSSSFVNVIDCVIEDLKSKHLINTCNNDISILEKGLQQINDIEQSRKTLENQSIGQFELSIKNKIPNISDAKIITMIDLLRKILVIAFEKRGLAISKALCTNESIRSDEIPEIFEMISNYANKLDTIEDRINFMDSAYDFLLKPNGPQKDYLMTLSQGYFFYHLAGLDPTCSKFRVDQLQNTIWLFDASIIIPLLAKGCHNHPYAKDLFDRLSKYHAPIITSEKLLNEIVQHYDFAAKFMVGKNLDSLQVMEASLEKAGYKQNLFLDGCICLAADGIVSNYDEYTSYIFPFGKNPEGIKKTIESYNIKVIAIPDISGFKIEDWGEINEIEENIRVDRIARGTFKSDEQVYAEAEVMLMINALRSGKCKICDYDKAIEKIYFVSQSHVLNRISDEENLVTWTPESVYRYVTTLPGENIDRDLLHQSMLQEYYYSGITFIDEQKYIKTFGYTINQSILKINTEKQRYLKELENTFVRITQADFDNIPDLEKPFFVTQMEWHRAMIAQAKAKAKEDSFKEKEEHLQKQVNHEKEELSRKNKERQKQVEATLRNFKDPKYRSKKTKQKKKRQRKKR